MGIRRGALGLVMVLAVAAAVIAVAVAGSSGDGSTPSAKAPESTVAAGVYAYMRIEFADDWTQTQGELVVMDGTERIGSAPFGLLGTRPEFTADGRYAFTLLLGDDLAVVSARNGKARTVTCEGCSDRQLKCQCQLVVPIGASRVAWLDGAHHLVVMDLSAAAPTPRRTDTTVPVEDGFLDERISPNLIAGTDGTALAAYPHGSLPGDDLLPAYLVTPDGKPRRLRPGRPDSIEEAAFSADGTHLALTGNQEYACASVTVVDVASGKGKTAPVSAQPGVKCKEHDVYVDSLWWDRDGSLNADVQADDDHPTAEDGQRRLEDGRWVAASTGPAVTEHHLDAGAKAVRDDWTLYVTVDAKRTKIDTKVRYVTVAPR